MYNANSLAFLIADSHPLFRKGLVHFLQNYYTDCRVHEATNCKELRKACLSTKYDTIFIDLKILEINNAEIIQYVKQKCAKSKIIAISTYEDEKSIHNSYKRGVDGFFAKTADLIEIANTVENIIQRKKFNEISNHIFFTLNNNNSKSVTEREKEVLILLCEEFSSKQIAEKLCLSIKTIENHRMHLLQKTNTHNAAGLVKYAVKKGWI